MWEIKLKPGGPTLYGKWPRESCGLTLRCEFLTAFVRGWPEDVLTCT